MAIPRQLTQIAFAAPLDESTEDEVLDPTIGFPVLQNVRQDHRGGVSKRLGFAALETDRTEGRRCFAHKGAPCVIASGRLGAYSEQLGADVDCGPVPDVSVEVRPLPASIDANYTPTQHDQVVCNGFLIFAYSNVTPDTGIAGANVLVTTADEGLVIRHDKALFGSTDPIFQVGAYSTTALLVTTAYSSSTIGVWKLDCSSASTVATGWVNVYSSNLGKDTASGVLSLQSLNDRVIVGFINNSGGTSRASVMAFDDTGLIQNRFIFTNSVTPDSVAVEGSASGTLWAVWNESTDINAIGLDPAALGTTTATAATVATGGLSTTNPPSIVSTSSGAASMVVQVGGGLVFRAAWTVTAGAVTPGASGGVLGAAVNGRAFLQGGRLLNIFFVSAVGAVSQGSLILADWSLALQTFPPLAVAYPNRASADPSAHVLTMPDGRMAHVVAVRTTAQTQSYALVIYDFTDRLRWRSAPHNGVTFLTGGILSYFSGDRVQECDFLHAPQNLDLTPDGGGTGPTGAVSYVVQFESVDGSGNLSLSGVSTPFTYTGTGVQTFPQCDPILLTSRAVVRASLYRTLENGTVYHLVETRNAIRGDTVVTFVDNKDDAALAGQPLLLGTGTLPGSYGGPLQREAPPYCADVVSYAGMLVVASGSDLWWSAQTVGGEGTWFSSEQFFVTVEGDGNITALAVLDGTLYVFKERAIYVVSGDAQLDNGSGGGLGTPRRLAGDVGCISASSVVVTSLGIFFQSHRGIELLGGGGRPDWIGEKVQRTLAAWPLVTSAALDARNNLVRFSLAASETGGIVNDYVYHPATGESPASETGGGRDLVFDLTLTEWQSVDDKGADNHYASQDACVVSLDGASRYAWLGADGLLHVETDSYLDDGSWIFMAAESAWFKLSGIQGKQQLNRLLTMARKRSAHGLSIAIGYNYDSSYDTAQAFTSDQIDALLESWPITQLRHDPNDNADGMAVRIRVQDAQPLGDGGYGSGQGSTWLALSLDITPKDGPAEVPEGAS